MGKPKSFVTALTDSKSSPCTFQLPSVKNAGPVGKTHGLLPGRNARFVHFQSQAVHFFHQLFHPFLFWVEFRCLHESCRYGYYFSFAFHLTPFGHLQLKLWSKYCTWVSMDHMCFSSYSFFLLFFNFFAPTSAKCSHFFVICLENKNQIICSKRALN